MWQLLLPRATLLSLWGVVTALTATVWSNSAAAAAAMGGCGSGCGCFLVGLFGGWSFTKYPVPVLVLERYMQRTYSFVHTNILYKARVVSHKYYILHVHM